MRDHSGTPIRRCWNVWGREQRVPETGGSRWIPGDDHRRDGPLPVRAGLAGASLRNDGAHGGSGPRDADTGLPRARRLDADRYEVGWTATASNASYELLQGTTVTTDDDAVAVGTTRNGEPVNPWVVGVTPDGDVDYDTVVEMDEYDKLFGVHPRSEGGAWAAGWVETGDDPSVRYARRADRDPPGRGRRRR